MILASGCFDGLHAGHVRYLQAAKKVAPGHSLYVLIAPDAYIRAAKHREPYWSQADRAHTVFALDCVNQVILQTAPTAAEEIRFRQPAFFVKGPDWRDHLPADVLHACQDVGAEVVYVQTPGRHVREARR